MKISISTLITSLILLISTNLVAQTDWKVGTSRIDITPKEPVWMGGYASRTKPGSGMLHPLWAKTMVFQDASGKKAIFVATDVLGFPKALSDKVRATLGKKYKVDKSQIILSSSHTHSGPVLTNALKDIYPEEPSEWARVDKYSLFFEQQVLQSVDLAMKALQPATVSAGNGVARFQVNRRNNDQPRINELFELKGPSDHSVPVIKVENAQKEIVGIIFGYACHPTVLNGYEFSGDYAGFAQIEIEKIYPKATALFFIGSAGDQNPLPRYTVPLAKQYGKELAASVERVISEPMKVMAPTLQTAYTEIDLKFDAPLSKVELQKIADSTPSYMQKWATRMLDMNKKGKPYMTSYPYPIQAWKIGDQALFSLGGEVTIEYTIHVKRLFGNDAFVAAYTNDVMGYIPSLKVLKEGGYEGDTSQMVYGLPAKWDEAIEDDIIKGITTIGKQIGLNQK